jgi:hypothetical protein
MNKLSCEEFFGRFSQFEVYMDGSYDSNVASIGIAFIKDNFYCSIEKAMTYEDTDGSIKVDNFLPGENNFLSCYFAEFYAFYELINILSTLPVTSKWELRVNTDNNGLANTFGGQDPWLISWLKKKWKRSDRKVPQQTPLLKKIIEKIIVSPNINLSSCNKMDIFNLSKDVFSFKNPVLDKNYISINLKFIFREQQKIAHDTAYNYMMKIRSKLL